MSDWENDDAPAPAPTFVSKAKSKFADEDVEDDIKDDWEEEDEEPPSPAPLPPPKKKGTVKKKIAEKEAAEAARKEAGEADIISEEEEWDVDPREKRRKEREAQIKADIANAADLLGQTNISQGDAISQLRSMEPSSKEDFEAYGQLLFDEFIKKYASKPKFVDNFVIPFSRLLCGPLRDAEVRKAATKLKELAEEKVKAEKDKKGGKKGAAKAKPAGAGNVKAFLSHDLKAYGDEALDDGDLEFM